MVDQPQNFKHENTSSHKLNIMIKLLFATIAHYNKNIDLFFPLLTFFSALHLISFAQFCYKNEQVNLHVAAT